MSLSFLCIQVKQDTSRGQGVMRYRIERERERERETTRSTYIKGVMRYRISLSYLCIQAYSMSLCLICLFKQDVMRFSLSLCYCGVMCYAV